MRLNREQWSMVVIGAIVVAIVAGALALDRAWDSHAPIGWAVGASAVITFTGFLAISDGDMIVRLRIAMTAAFVVTYVVLLGMVTFLIDPVDGTGSSEVSSTLVTNFTVLMGTVVAFYFGSSAVVKVTKINAVSRDPAHRSEIEEAARDDVRFGPLPAPPPPR